MITSHGLRANKNITYTVTAFYVPSEHTVQAQERADDENVEFWLSPVLLKNNDNKKFPQLCFLKPPTLLCSGKQYTQQDNPSLCDLDRTDNSFSCLLR